MIYYEFDWNLNDSSGNNRDWTGGWTIENKAWTQQEREDYYNLTKWDYWIS